MCDELDVLGRALAVNDHAQIRAAAEKTAATLHNQMEERRHREQRQIDLLQDSMEKLRNELNQMRHAAKIDGLTKLFNRGALDEHVELVADQSFFTATESCIVMVDIDHFKGVNDNFGHQAGDEVLRQVAEELVRGFFRREDFVARYGGEEFCIIAEHTTFETTRERAERLRQAVENLAIVAFGKTLRVSVSFGIAALQYGETAANWIQRADEALYRAKMKGRNCISIAPKEGDALGGQGAPLGATLNLRASEGARIIQVTSPPSSRREATNSSGTPGPKLSQQTKRLASSTHNSEAPISVRKEGAKRKVGKTRPLGKPARKEPAVTQSPISALLGPTSRR
jgi:diguanylate cyclase (GGDEF)-like protein